MIRSPLAVFSHLSVRLPARTVTPRSRAIPLPALLVATALLWLAVPPAIAQDTTGTGGVAGVVVSGDGKPAPGVTICIVGTGRCATSDEKGEFRLPSIRLGQQHIEVRAPGLPPYASGHVEVRAGFETMFEVVLPKIDALTETVSVTAPAFVAPEEVKTSGFLLASRDIKQAAGTLQDVSRFAQTLPGVVVGSNDFRNDLIVRGGSPLENLFVVDNIEVPNINAFATSASAGGSVGLVDAELIRDVTFLSGGYPATFGNRVSSVTQLALREGSRDGARQQVSVGFLGAGGVFEGPIGGGKGSWIVSARRSFLDFFTDDIGVGGVPVIYALNMKAVYDLSERDRVWAVNITGVDRLRLGATTESDPAESELATLDIVYDGYRSATGVNWQRVFGSRGVGLLGVTQSVANVETAYKDLLRAPPGGADDSLDALIARSPVIYSEDSIERETTFKYDYTRFGRTFRKIQVGAAVKRVSASYLAAQPFGYDNAWSATPGSDTLDLDFAQVSYDVGGYAQATWDPSARFGVTFGGRADRYGYTGKTRVSPRLAVSCRLTGNLTWQASYGLYYQQASPLLLAAFPVNRTLDPLRADHYVTGIAWTPEPSLKVTAEGYWKEYRDYPVAVAYPEVTLANIGDTFDVRESLFPLASAGRGRAYGFELVFEKRFTDRWFAQANVALSKTRHAGLDGVLRPGTFDYPAVAKCVGGYRVNSRWEVGGRFTYLSGRPYTPYDDDASAAQRRGIYDRSRVNGVRAGAYVRLDIRVDWILIAGRQTLLIYGGAQNITNRRNFAGFSWDRTNNRTRFQEQQGLFPLIGMEWRF
jgi:hypothetical protein